MRTMVLDLRPLGAQRSPRAYRTPGSALGKAPHLQNLPQAPSFGLNSCPERVLRLMIIDEAQYSKMLETHTIGHGLKIA